MGFGALLGFACMRCANFKPFWPLALAQQAQPAIILQPLRRLGGAAVFRNPRPSASWGFPFWPSGLTLRSSRPAKAGGLSWSLGAFNAHSPDPLCRPWERGGAALHCVRSVCVKASRGCHRRRSNCGVELVVVFRAGTIFTARSTPLHARRGCLRRWGVVMGLLGDSPSLMQCLLQTP